MLTDKNIQFAEGKNIRNKGHHEHSTTMDNVTSICGTRTVLNGTFQPVGDLEAILQLYEHGIQELRKAHKLGILQ